MNVVRFLPRCQTGAAEAFQISDRRLQIGRRNVTGWRALVETMMTADSLQLTAYGLGPRRTVRATLDISRNDGR